MSVTPSSSNQFGELVTADEFEDALVAKLQLWLPTYTAELERRKGRDPGTIPQPKSWQVRHDAERWPEQHLPAVMVICAGTEDDVARRAEGVHDAGFAVSVAHWVSTGDEAATRRLNRWYCALMRWVLLQQPIEVQGVVVTLRWRGEAYDGFPVQAGRTLGAGHNVFRVEMDHVVESGTRPMMPDAVSYTDDPTADTVYVDGNMMED